MYGEIEGWEERIEEMLEDFGEDPERRDHLNALADAFFDNLQRDNCEYGAWGVDSKRPFGNSAVEPDIAEIIGFEREWLYDKNGDYDEDNASYLNRLYDDLGPWLKYRWNELKRK